MSNINSKSKNKQKKSNNIEKKGTKKNIKETKANTVKEIFKSSEVVNEKENKRKTKKNIFIKVFDIILWVVLIAWMIIVVIDYIKVVTKKEPIFCINRKEIKYEDGTVNSCTGLGYKVHKYNRESYQAIEFGPFWIKVKNNN